MSYDFYAAREEVKHQVQDLYAQIQLSANDLGDASTKNQHNRRFMRRFDNYVQGQLKRFSELLTVEPLSAIECLPDGAAVLRFEMRLARPFMSKDDTSYYICDNPVRKDWVFHLPMMSATGWKGTLRATASRILAHESEELSQLAFAEHRLRLTLLFGNEKEGGEAESFLDQAGGAEAARIYQERLEQHTETGFLAGRLRFYSTFFDKVTVEVINPHDRVKKAGKLPIYFEAADIGAKGMFSLLYVPCDLIGKSTEEMTSEIADDLKVLGTALRAMLNTYGFGAKTSSGFGVVEEKLAKPGKLLLRIAGLPLEKPEKPKPTKVRRKRRKLRRYWKAENQLKDKFLTDTGDLVPESQYKAYIQSLGQEYTRSDRQLYNKACKWWKREGKDLAEEAAAAEALKSEKEADTPEEPWAERTFTSLTQMVEKIQSLAADLAAKEETNE
jgi:CRISPR-associated protein Cmr2